MIPLLVPDGVLVVEAADGDWVGELHPEEAGLIAGVGERRRRDVTAGRRCAGRALAGLEFPPGPVLAGPDRAPVWPAGVVGSITHTPGYCAAAVAWAYDVPALGIDAEANRRLGPKVVDLICRPDEPLRGRRLVIGACPAVDYAIAVFSAKEATYKAWYPVARRMLGFHHVRVEIDGVSGRFGAEVIAPGPTVAPLLYDGRLAVTSTHVFAVATVAGDDSLKHPFRPGEALIEGASYARDP